MKVISAPSPIRDEAWQKAQHRLCLYLRLLEAPPLASLSLALEAMKRAIQDDALEGQPLQKAMEALREVLEEQSEASGKDLPWSLFAGRRQVRRNTLTPPLNRGFMVPEEIR